MIEILFSVALIMLTVAVVAMAKFIKRLSKEIDEIKEKLGHYRIKFQYLESYARGNEHRIDELEDMLDLKEWFDKEKGGKNEND